MTEIEVALVIFAWNTDYPTLATWLVSYPQVLWRIDAFFLRRYSLQLSAALEKAVRAAHGHDATGGAPHTSLNRPPYRAGEFAQWQPRVAGLVTVGMLALFGYSDLTGAICGALQVQPAVVLATALIGLNFTLLYIDVYKQNRGVMGDRRHGIRRTLTMLWWFVSWGALDLAVLTAAVQLAGSDAIRVCLAATDTGTAGRQLAGAAVYILAACAIGMLVQWLWEDKSAAEPV